ncbi:hypothetical protein [Kineococcus esterisolvens]|uniref:hypothetical protein n=1 Tax=unclassified Kineococcus TaxID=2621656 RepID=UPI003D7E7D67
MGIPKPSMRSRWISLRRSLVKTVRQVIGAPEAEDFIPAYDPELPRGVSSYGPAKKARDRS